MLPAAMHMAMSPYDTMDMAMSPYHTMDMAILQTADEVVEFSGNKPGPRIYSLIVLSMHNIRMATQDASHVATL